MTTSPYLHHRHCTYTIESLGCTEHVPLLLTLPSATAASVQEDRRYPRLHPGHHTGASMAQGITAVPSPVSHHPRSSLLLSETRNALCFNMLEQDGNKVEYEDVLPYQQFALRIPFAWVHQLPEILEVVVKRGWVPIMQRRLRCVKLNAKGVTTAETPRRVAAQQQEQMLW